MKKLRPGKGTFFNITILISGRVSTPARALDNSAYLGLNRPNKDIIGHLFFKDNTARG